MLRRQFRETDAAEVRADVVLDRRLIPDDSSHSATVSITRVKSAPAPVFSLVFSAKASARRFEACGFGKKCDAGIVKCVLEMALSVVLDGGIPKLLLLAI
jgi:hypothetical protein